MVNTFSELPRLPANLTARSAAEQRATSWLVASGGLDWVTPAAWSLLVARLQIRRTLGVRIAVSAMALWIAAWLAIAILTPVQIGNLATHFALAVSLMLVLALTVVSWQRVTLRAEQREAAAFGERLTRGQAPRLREAIGWWRCAAIGIVVGTDVVFLSVAWATAPPRQALAASAVLSIGWAIAVALLVAALHRPTIAVDPVSLTIDERLRAKEATAPLVLGYLASAYALPMVSKVYITPIGLIATFAGIGVVAAAFMPRLWSRPSWLRWARSR